MAVKIFFCYAHEDEPLLNKLKTHLRPLQRQGLIDIWHDRDISAGAEREREISQHLNTAQIILLLVSPDFMNSDYCYGIEMRRAIDRHERGEACVIPIILRPVDWQIEPLSKLQALPRDAEPVTMWQNYDAAFLDVAKGIRKVVKKLAPKSSVNSSVTPMKTIEELTTQFSLTLPIIPVQAPQPEPVKLVSASKPEDFTLIRTLTGHSDFVSPVAFSSDGQTLASSGGFADQKIMLWNLHTADLLHILAGHSSTVFSIVISPNGQILASGSHDKTIKLWNLHTGELFRTLAGHLKKVVAIAISPDGLTLASGSDDKTIKIWGKK